MAEPAGPATGRRVVGPFVIGVVTVLTAGLLILPLMLLVLGVLAGLSTWIPSVGDPTWNDGDAGLGLCFGGVATTAVLAVAAGVFGLLARRFRLPVRVWVFGSLAGSLLLAGLTLGVAF